MKKINEIDLKNKNVVVRFDYNVPINDGIISDNSKILKSLPTLNYLLNNNCRIVILSHLGRVKCEEDKAKKSLKPVAKMLSNLVKKKVMFVDNCYGDKVKEIVDNSKNGDIILLENTRFMDYPEKLESNNDLELAKYWASLGDIFINDAFASLHRAHASTAGISAYLPSALGFLVEGELNNLDILIHNTPHPFVVFMGGAKVDDKLPIINSLLPKCDKLLLGGGIANSFMKSIGADVGTSVATNDEEILNNLKDIINEYKNKIILPVDFVMDDGAIYDVGMNSIDVYKKYIDAAKLIFVNGTCGKFEDERFVEGTSALFKVLDSCGDKVIVGGGDTASAAKNLGYESSFKFISSGGGATLEYIANGTLDAIEWMDKNEVSNM